MRSELAFAVGAIMGGWMAVVILMNDTSPHAQAIKAIEECEAALPRSQHCVVSAKPLEKTQHDQH